MLVKTYCAAVNGLEVTTVTVEVSLNKGVMYHLTGLGDEAVRESRNRIAAAMQYSGYKFPIADITINLAPANLRKEGSSFDLPLAIGILGANGNIPEDHLKEYMMVGELSLDGTLQPIKGALPIAIKARSEHYKGLIVPEQNAREAAVVNNLEVYGMKNLFDVIQFLGDKSSPTPTIVDTRKEFYENQVHCDYDYADVKGQEKREACLGSSRCRRSQSHHGRSSRLGKIHDGKASPLHSSTPYSLRKSGNYPDTFYSWQISQERLPHCPAPFQSASPYHLSGCTGRRRHISTTR